MKRILSFIIMVACLISASGFAFADNMLLTNLKNIPGVVSVKEL